MNFDNMVCLGVGLGIPIFVLVMFARHVVRPMASANAYRQAAFALGLPPDTRGLSLAGHIDGRRIWVGQVAEGHGQDRRTELRAMLDLQHPLGLGLILRTRGPTQRVFRRYRAARLALGDPWFDNRFSVRGVHQARVESLFDETVKEAIRTLTHRWPDVMITDHWVQVSPRTAPVSQDEILDLVTELRGVCVALEAARRRLGLSDGLESLAQSWRELADRLGLSTIEWLPGIKGAIDGWPVSVSCVRQGSSFSAEVQLLFVKSPGIGLVLRPQLEPSVYATVGQDIEFGAADFDDAFVVKGYDSNVVRATLRPEIQTLLLDLVDHGQVVVDDRGIEIRQLALDSTTLEQMLTGAVKVAAALGW